MKNILGQTEGQTEVKQYSPFPVEWGYNYQRGKVGIPLTSICLPHLCTCPKTGPRFQTIYVMVFFLCSMVSGERCLFILLILVKIGDNHSLNFLLIIIVIS